MGFSREAQFGAECVSNVWDFLEHLYEKGGVGIIAFLVIAYAFHKLVWKVWAAAMWSKNCEIERLIHERNYYLSKFFPDMPTSDGRNSE